MYLHMYTFWPRGQKVTITYEAKQQTTKNPRLESGFFVLESRFTR